LGFDRTELGDQGNVRRVAAVGNRNATAAGLRSRRISVTPIGEKSRHTPPNPPPHGRRVSCLYLTAGTKIFCQNRSRPDKCLGG